MTYSFEAFCADNRRAYDADGVADLESIRLNLERLIRENPDFVARECNPRDDYGYRELYTDPEKGFIVYSHKSFGGRTSPPHDHGASWAIYGQAWNATDMTEYRRLDDGSQDGHANGIERGPTGSNRARSAGSARTISTRSTSRTMPVLSGSPAPTCSRSIR